MKESKIFNQDCLKTMSAIGKEKADLILTDPPYNLGLFMKNRDPSQIFNFYSNYSTIGPFLVSLIFTIWLLPFSFLV